MSTSAVLDQLRTHADRNRIAMPHLYRETRTNYRTPTSAPVKPAGVRPPSTAAKQAGYISELLGRLRDHNPEAHEKARAFIAANAEIVINDPATRVRTIKALHAHLSAPAAPRYTSRTRSVHEILADVESDRRYALLKPGTENDWKFYRVATSKAGRKYILVGHADGMGISWEYVRDAHDIAVRLAADPHEAMLDFGRQLGKCGHCGRVLTNQASREAGIGPICARG